MTKPKPRHGAPVPGPPCPRPSPPTLATTRPRLNCVPSGPAIKSCLRAAVEQKSRHVHISTIEKADSIVKSTHCRQEQKERERLVVTILHSHHKFGTPFRTGKKSTRTSSLPLTPKQQLLAWQQWRIGDQKKKTNTWVKRKEHWRRSNCRWKEVNFKIRNFLLRCFEVPGKIGYLKKMLQKINKERKNQIKVCTQERKKIWKQPRLK